MNFGRRTSFRAFQRDQSGAALAEYSILIGLIAFVAIVVVGVLGNQVNGQYQKITTEWQKVTPSTDANEAGKQDPASTQ